MMKLGVQYVQVVYWFAFFKIFVGKAVAVNDIWYHLIINHLCQLELKNINLKALWIQQDGVTPHFTYETY